MAQLADTMDLSMESAELNGKNCPDETASGLADLPESCLASILSYTTPRDVARLACVSPTFRLASQSDLVWEKMLPPAYAAIVGQAEHPPPKGSPKKEVYEFLCNRVILQDGTRDYWLDRATGGVCQSIGARGLTVIWGDDNRYWDWAHERPGSRFSEIAYLKLVWWLEIRARADCTLHPGTYTITWRMIEQFKRHCNPVSFIIEATGNDQVKAECHFPISKETALSEQPEGQHRSLACRRDEDDWLEIDVGEFTVESEDSPMEINCAMTEIESGAAKSGLYLDSVMIRPSYVIPKQVWGRGDRAYTEEERDERSLEEMLPFRRRGAARPFWNRIWRNP